MTHDSSPRQKSEQPGCPTGNKDETRAPMVRDVGLPAIHEPEDPGRVNLLQGSSRTIKGSEHGNSSRATGEAQVLEGWTCLCSSSPCYTEKAHRSEPLIIYLFRWVVVVPGASR